MRTLEARFHATCPLCHWECRSNIPGEAPLALSTHLHRQHATRTSVRNMLRRFRFRLKLRVVKWLTRFLTH